MKASMKNGNKKISSVGATRQLNLKRVVSQMRRLKDFSRIDLAKKLKISSPTMTKLFAQLEQQDLISLSPKTDKSFGRPKILYQLSPTLQIATIVVDVETTQVAFSSLGCERDTEVSISFPTQGPANDFFTTLTSKFRRLQDTYECSIQLVGICIPGLVDTDSGTSMLNPNIPWLESIQIAEEMSKRVKVPTFIMHEEKALCRAQFQSLDDSSSYITLDFSSGVGMGVVENGNYLKGRSGFAGEIGHVVLRPDGKRCGCGNRGCLETIASDRVFKQDLNLTMTEALLELRKGTKRSLSVAEHVMKAQASGMAMVITMFNPEVLFIHSRLANVYPNYLKRIQEETQKQTLSLSYNDCSIQVAKEGKVGGAIYLTIDQLIEQSI